MTAYHTPGVYFEQADTRSDAVNAVRTDVAGFVGIAARGPTHYPVKVESWAQFVSVFGAFVPQGYLAYAVSGFFANGGRTCWVVRVADPDSASAASATLFDASNRPAVLLTAACRIDHAGSIRTTSPARLDAVYGRDPENDVTDDPGVLGNSLTVSVLGTGPGRFSLTVTRPGEPPEVFRDLTSDPADDRDVVKVLNGAPLPPRVGRNVERRPRKATNAPLGSRLVRATDLRGDGAPVTLDDRLLRLSGGRDGLAPSAVVADPNGNPALLFVATPTGSIGSILQITCTPKNGGVFGLEVIDLPNPRNVETWDALSLDPADPRYIVAVVNDRRKGPSAGSALVSVRDMTPPRQKNSRTGLDAPLAPSARASDWLPTGEFRLRGGLSPAHLTGGIGATDERLGLSALEVIDEVSVVAVPDLLPPQPTPAPAVQARPSRCDGPPPQAVALPPVPESPAEAASPFTDDQVDALHDTLILHAERLKDRVVLLDPPATVANVLPTTGVNDVQGPRVLNWVAARAFDSKYAALYYPWLRVDDPLGLSGSTRAVPPSGHVAGVFARSDRDFGVHKPPANMELRGARDVTDRVNDASHGDLNDRGINVIRPYPGRGVRVYGARTLSSDPDWRFLNVRRLLIMIEASIDRETQWVVFEPNNTGLRDDLDRVIRNFLDGLWAKGMLDGATANEAYEVRCDDSTNPPEETDAGRLICLVGVQPPSPAEFVIVRVGKTREGTLILEDA